MIAYRQPSFAVLAGSISIILLILSGCGAGSQPADSQPPAPREATAPAATPTPAPTETFDTTSMLPYTITDFEAAHAPVNGDANEHLIFGSLSIGQPAPDAPPDVAALIGRWEGYSYGPPVNKDWKFVLAIQEIGALHGRAVIWAGTNLQYPGPTYAIEFRVVREAGHPGFEWQYDEPAAGVSRVKFIYDEQEKILRGWLTIPGGTMGPIKLNRERTLTVFKDYPAYLAGKGITSRTYKDAALQTYGKGCLVYLPDGYDADPKKTWPLIVFLHGTGDRGDNEYILAKASPFMMIREKGPLPAIIIAPLLNTSKEYVTFPEEYMEGVLAEALADYRVDRKRIYLTGLSMGGEATYRFALNRPDTFAAIAPLAAFNPKYAPWAISSGYKPFDIPMARIKDLPVWDIQGADDPIVSKDIAQKTVDDLRQAGGNVTFTVLEKHDHDVWTDTYSDPGFYQWLLDHSRP